MTNRIDLADVKELPPLDLDQAEDASFRAKDLAWAALVELFEERKAHDKISYQSLGERIGRSRKQVQRWLRTSMNMNLASFGLLAEGLDSDIEIKLIPRADEVPAARRNAAHPSERARHDFAFHSQNDTESSCHIVMDWPGSGGKAASNSNWIHVRD